MCVQIGDIPDAEMKPPDNVLFVCKLNPVTEVSAWSLIVMGNLYHSFDYEDATTLESTNEMTLLLSSLLMNLSFKVIYNSYLFLLQDEDLHTIFSRFGTVSS